MEEHAIQCVKWLETRVHRAEANDPKLRPLKDRINALAIELTAAHEDAIPALIQKQDEVIQELIEHVSKKYSN
jgi:hypothetical protein